MPLADSVSPAWLLTGMGGVLGWGAATRPPEAPAVLAARSRPLHWRHADAVELELRSPGSLSRLVEEIRPKVVVHAACLSRAADCAADAALTRRVNVEAVAELVESAERAGSFVVYVSTEQVFAGTAARYRESDPPDSRDPYGASKAEAEALVLAAGGAVARLPLLLGPRVGPGRQGADTATVEAVKGGGRPRLFVDEWRCPVAADEAAAGLWRLAETRRGGVVHLAGPEAVSRHELGRLALEAAGLDPDAVDAGSVRDFTGPPRQPKLVLDCRRARDLLGWEPQDLRQSLARLSGMPCVP
jgi:dTDP-4-dehydrorhamnose reductase